MYKLIVIPAEPSLAIIEYNGLEPQLGTLQRFVGGYIEVVPMFEQFEGKPCRVYCNEEGKLHNLLINHRATLIWRGEVARLTTNPLQDWLCGDVVIAQLVDQSDEHAS